MNDRQYLASVYFYIMIFFTILVLLERSNSFGLPTGVPPFGRHLTMPASLYYSFHKVVGSQR